MVEDVRLQLCDTRTLSGESADGESGLDPSSQVGRRRGHCRGDVCRRYRPAMCRVRSGHLVRVHITATVRVDPVCMWIKCLPGHVTASSGISCGQRAWDVRV